MKKITKILCCLLVLISTIFIGGCNNKKPASTMITLNINPSIEIIVDEEKKVVSVTALNDDASVLLYGEVIVGLDIEDATNKIMNLCVEMGYTVDDSTDKIEISVSGETNFQKDLEKIISKEIEKVLDEYNLDLMVEKVESIKIDALRQLVMVNSTLTEEEISQMSEEELVNALRESRIETQEILNEEMKKFYFQMKNYEISFAEREFTSQIIDQLGTLYQIIHTSYSTSLNIYQNIIFQVEELKYNMLIDSDSLYQQTLSKVLEAKTKYLEQNKYVAKLEAGSLKVEAEVKLEELKDVYDNLISTLQTVQQEAVNAFDKVIGSLKDIESGLVKIEGMFDENIKQTLSQKAQEFENILNETKTKFFTEFENKYQDDLSAYENMIKKQKEELKK